MSNWKSSRMAMLRRPELNPTLYSILYGDHIELLKEHSSVTTEQGNPDPEHYPPDIKICVSVFAELQKNP